MRAYEQTFEEYAGQPNKRHSRRTDIGNMTAYEWHRDWHRRLILGALTNGMPVPDRVLAEYPGLSKDTPI